METFSITSLFDYIFRLFDLTYMITVLLGMEFLKFHIPRVGAAKKTLLTLLVAIFVAGLFIGINIIAGSDEPVDVYTKRLLISFLGVTTFYSLIVKAVISAVRKGLKQKEPNKPENEETV